MLPRSGATVLKNSGETGTRSVTTRCPLRSGMTRRLTMESASPSCNNPAKDNFPAGINLRASASSFVLSGLTFRFSKDQTHSSQLILAGLLSVPSLLQEGDARSIVSLVVIPDRQG